MDMAGVRELLRPPPHRGPLIAAGAVALGVGSALEEIRLADKLGNGVHMVILLAAGILVISAGVLGLVGIVDPSREPHCADCPGGAFAGAPSIELPEPTGAAT